ncbi:MAG: winged helix-turn-helix transcriptional regulator [Candidatus Woesearchaeota archaeon]|nr:MAG: winged helix-turn-helix transcriptional regulator [Candidatus Woesearchaeota archaeon]
MPPLFDEIVHKALASDVRRNILLSISEKEKYLTEISKDINKKPQTVDFHLNLLEEIGIVESSLKDGKKYYFLKDKRILDFLRDRKPIPANLRPKPPHEIMLEAWEDIKERLDRIEKKIDELSK